MSPIEMVHPAHRIAIVERAARWGAITAEALALRDGCAIGSARARLIAAQRARLLSRARPLADHPALFTVTRRGLVAAGLTGIAPGRVTAANARHTIICAHVAAALERAYPDHRATGERELRREESARSEPLASVSLGAGLHGAPLLHRPDIVLWPNGPSATAPVAVEVELTVKAPRRLIAICRAWARSRRVAGVLYLVAPEVRGPLARAIDAAHASDRIAVLGLEDLPAATPRSGRGSALEKKIVL